MWSHLLALACALLLLPAPALAGAKEEVAALAPSGLVLVLDEEGNELVAQKADQPFVPASVTKIVTAWLAMEVLGGDYRFETRFYLGDDRGFPKAFDVLHELRARTSDVPLVVSVEFNDFTQGLDQHNLPGAVLYHVTGADSIDTVNRTMERVREYRT